MSEPTPTEPEKRRFRLGRFVLWCLGGFVVVAVGLFGLDQAQLTRRIKATVGRLDETDPGWRLEEIEAARDTLPDARNSAVLCRELARLMPRGWPDAKFAERMSKVVLPQRLDAEGMKALEAEMKRVEPMRLVARPLADMPRGRHRLDYDFHPLLTRLPDQQQTRELAAFFTHEMLYLSNAGDISGAIRSGRACVCAGRSLDDEPILMSQLIRNAMVVLGLNGVEGALSLGESKESELAALDELLADEEAQNSLLVGLRGERAGMYRLFSRLGSGAISADGLHEEVGLSEGSLLRHIAAYPRWQIRRQQPAMLDAMTRLVENARLPSHEQIPGEEAIDRELKTRKSSGSFVATFIPATIKVGNICRRKAALVAAMRGAIAVERFRMKHGKWPAKLEDVVPAFLGRVPTDPFDGTPLKLVRTADGVIVYTVGVDGVDDGGKLNRKKPMAPGADIGIQLWDREKRARPASPPKPEEVQP